MTMQELGDHWDKLAKRTRAYLEYIAGVPGPAALAVWLRYTGWSESLAFAHKRPGDPPGLTQKAGPLTMSKAASNYRRCNRRTQASVEKRIAAAEQAAKSWVLRQREVSRALKVPHEQRSWSMRA